MLFLFYHEPRRVVKGRHPTVAFLCVGSLSVGLTVFRHMADLPAFFRFRKVRRFRLFAKESFSRLSERDFDKTLDFTAFMM